MEEVLKPDEAPEKQWKRLKNLVMACSLPFILTEISPNINSESKSKGIIDSPSTIAKIFPETSSQRKQTIFEKLPVEGVRWYANLYNLSRELGLPDKISPITLVNGNPDFLDLESDPRFSELSKLLLRDFEYERYSPTFINQLRKLRIIVSKDGKDYVNETQLNKEISQRKDATKFIENIKKIPGLWPAIERYYAESSITETDGLRILDNISIANSTASQGYFSFIYGNQTSDSKVLTADKSFVMNRMMINPQTPEIRFLYMSDYMPLSQPMILSAIIKETEKPSFQFLLERVREKSQDLGIEFRVNYTLGLPIGAAAVNGGVSLSGDGKLESNIVFYAGYTNTLSSTSQNEITESIYRTLLTLQKFEERKKENPKLNIEDFLKLQDSYEVAKIIASPEVQLGTLTRDLITNIMIKDLNFAIKNKAQEKSKKVLNDVFKHNPQLLSDIYSGKITGFKDLSSQAQEQYQQYLAWGNSQEEPKYYAKFFNRELKEHFEETGDPNSGLSLAYNRSFQLTPEEKAKAIEVLNNMFRDQGLPIEVVAQSGTPPYVAIPITNREKWLSQNPKWEAQYTEWKVKNFIDEYFYNLIAKVAPKLP